MNSNSSSSSSAPPSLEEQLCGAWSISATQLQAFAPPPDLLDRFWSLSFDCLHCGNNVVQKGGVSRMKTDIWVDSTINTKLGRITPWPHKTAENKGPHKVEKQELACGNGKCGKVLGFAYIADGKKASSDALEGLLDRKEKVYLRHVKLREGWTREAVEKGEGRLSYSLNSCFIASGVLSDTSEKSNIEKAKAFACTSASAPHKTSFIQDIIQDMNILLSVNSVAYRATRTDEGSSSLKAADPSSEITAEGHVLGCAPSPFISFTRRPLNAFVHAGGVKQVVVMSDPGCEEAGCNMIIELPGNDRTAITRFKHSQELLVKDAVPGSVVELVKSRLIECDPLYYKHPIQGKDAPEQLEPYSIPDDYLDRKWCAISVVWKETGEQYILIPAAYDLAKNISYTTDDAEATKLLHEQVISVCEELGPSLALIGLSTKYEIWTQRKMGQKKLPHVTVPIVLLPVLNKGHATIRKEVAQVYRHFQHLRSKS